LRQDYDKITGRGAEILVMGPDGPNAFKRYWQENEMPFVGMADIKSKVADQYFQEVNILKLGRMPAVFVIDQNGKIRYSHYASKMSDLPENEELFEVLDMIELEQAV
jgi:peroxiredoxin